MNVEYIIVGDTEKYGECLVCVASRTYTQAEKILNRILHNPTDNDKALIKYYKNLRIKEVDSKDCWWNKDCD